MTKMTPEAARELLRLQGDAEMAVQSAFFAGYEDGYRAGYEKGYDDGFFDRMADWRHDVEDERDEL